ncbi:hypothetical protein VZC37_14505 [Gordonia sp. LSe1-13]|uniref:Uncharacterized protein n=1 Tax=Gordonia sesuvii TaxID=3116777 RepID=A0ABU7MEP9_9ACTN|nr:hypothetical protein [Gordonia sp. LSe1-13]
MTDDRADGDAAFGHTITSVRPAWFLLARPTQNADDLPATIGEQDVFFDGATAMDALDLHYAWCAAQRGGYHAEAVRGAQWYLQSAMIGPQVTPGLGQVYLASSDPLGGRRAVGGGFLTEGELIHWTAFVRTATRYMPTGPTAAPFELAYLGDDGVDFGHIWFSPLQSRRVFPQRIVVDPDN